MQHPRLWPSRQPRWRTCPELRFSLRPVNQGPFPLQSVAGVTALREEAEGPAGGGACVHITPEGVHAEGALWACSPPASWIVSSRVQKRGQADCPAWGGWSRQGWGLGVCVRSWHLALRAHRTVWVGRRPHPPGVKPTPNLLRPFLWNERKLTGQSPQNTSALGPKSCF